MVSAPGVLTDEQPSCDDPLCDDPLFSVFLPVNYEFMHRPEKHQLGSGQRDAMLGDVGLIFSAVEFDLHHRRCILRHWRISIKHFSIS